MHTSTVTAFLSLCILNAGALNITAPRAGDVLDPTQDITVKWTSNSDDPPRIDLYLTGTDTNSGFAVATNISTSDNQYEIPPNTIITNEADHVINVNTPGDQGNNFVAQSGEFTIDLNKLNASTATSSSSASAVSPSATGSTASRGVDANCMPLVIIGSALYWVLVII